VEDLGTGEYRARFTATAAGSYSVAVRLGGQNVSGSPFSAEVAAATIAADCSYVVQEGLEQGISGSQVQPCSACQSSSRCASLKRRHTTCKAEAPAATCAMHHGETNPLINVTPCDEIFFLGSKLNLCRARSRIRPPSPALCCRLQEALHMSNTPPCVSGDRL